jgi:hypothetical protein
MIKQGISLLVLLIVSTTSLIQANEYYIGATYGVYDGSWGTSYDHRFGSICGDDMSLFTDQSSFMVLPVGQVYHVSPVVSGSNVVAEPWAGGYRIAGRSMSQQLTDLNVTALYHLDGSLVPNTGAPDRSFDLSSVRSVIGSRVRTIWTGSTDTNCRGWSSRHDDARGRGGDILNVHHPSTLCTDHHHVLCLIPLASNERNR